jgi:hypothetical protein
MNDTALVFSYERVAVRDLQICSPDRIKVSFTKEIDSNSFADAGVIISPGEFSPFLSLSSPDTVDIEFGQAA